MQSQRSDKNSAAWNKKTLEIRDPQSSAPLCPSCPPETGAWCGHGEKATNERIVKGRTDKKLSSPSDSVFFLCHFLFQTFIRTSSTQTAPLLKHPNTQDSPSPTPSNPDRSFDIAADERSLVCLHLAGTCAGSLLLHGRSSLSVVSIPRHSASAPSSSPSREAPFRRRLATTTQWHPKFLPSHPTTVPFQIHVH